jgi:Zn-dependent oligopeptidase
MLCIQFAQRLFTVNLRKNSVDSFKVFPFKTKLIINNSRGTSVERDFVEAPSQMLENWCWNKEALKLMSSHYKTGAPIDEKLVDDLIKAKNSFSGIFTMR